MTTVDDIYSIFKERLMKIYSPEESEQITVLTFEHVLNLKRIDISMNKGKSLDQESINEFEKILSGLGSGMPIQYVLGKAWFYGMDLMVNENVLIPRRETEELVNWIVKDIHSMDRKPSLILDVCTGSGCIALALKKEFPEITVSAIDNSEKALEVARFNSKKFQLPINFNHMDALNLSTDMNPDIIVSNPPYVRISEKEKMHEKVLQHEPHSALFVPDEDPLTFYSKIAGHAMASLKENGKLFFEINEGMGKDVGDLLTTLGFQSVELRKDLQGKDRMIRAVKGNLI